MNLSENVNTNYNPEFFNLCAFLSAKFNVLKVEPLYFSGTVGGSEFNTYVATKLYLAHSVFYSSDPSTGSIADVSGYVYYYNEVFSQHLILTSSSAFYDSTALAIKKNIPSVALNDFYFARHTVSGYSFLKFNGYRLTIAI